MPTAARARRTAGEAFERWDGRGGPAGTAGDQLGIEGRLAQVAFIAALFHRRHGPAAALGALAARSGGLLDPDLVDVFTAAAPELFASIDDSRSRACCSTKE